MKYRPVYRCAYNHIIVYKEEPIEASEENFGLYIPAALSRPCPLCVEDYKAGRRKQVGIAYLRYVEEVENV